MATEKPNSTWDRLTAVTSWIPRPLSSAQWTDLANKALTSNRIPDAVVRRFIRLELWDRLRQYTTKGFEARMSYKMDFIESLKTSPIALVPQKANEQHYEVPSKFYTLCLGSHLKYSSAVYPDLASGKHTSLTLDQAEDAMLTLYVERAQLQDGMTIVDLGCGWGSFSLFAAKRFPKSKIVGVSNSNTQREFILSEAKTRGLSNLEIYTGDINKFQLPSKYVGQVDRLVSIEMFEHMKNYDRLFALVASWLKPQTGKVFLHVFCHREYPYHFEGDSWMTKYFFSGGTMPSEDLFHYFQQDLQLERQWRVSGKHYAQTCRHWLQNMDRNIAQIRPVFADAYGAHQVEAWIAMWRTFYMACEELFDYAGGSEWFVAHYLFRPTDVAHSR